MILLPSLQQQDSAMVSILQIEVAASSSLELRIDIHRSGDDLTQYYCFVAFT